MGQLLDRLLQSPKRRSEWAMAGFHLGVARAAHADDLVRDDQTLPLIPLVLILAADGTLAEDARRVLEIANS